MSASTLTRERPPFSQIPDWIPRHPDLDHAAVRVYLILMIHADNGTRDGFPGMRRIAEEACMATSTVQRSLEVLEQVGAVIVTRTWKDGENGRHRAVNHYFMPWLPFGKSAETVSQPSVQTPAEVSPSSLQGVTTIDTPPVTTIDTELDPVLNKTHLTRSGGGKIEDETGEKESAKPKPNPPKRGLRFAVEEARKDSSVRDPDRVGRFRYDEEPAKYEAMADRAELADRAKACRRCGGSGLLHFRIDGTETDRDDIDAEIAEPCDHRPALAVVGGAG